MLVTACTPEPRAAAPHATAPVGVLLVDDNAAILATLSKTIGAWPGYEVVGKLDSADDLVGAVAATRPGVVVLDIDMPGRNPCDAIEDLRRQGASAKIVVLSALGSWAIVRECFHRGAYGYVLKEDAPDALPKAIAAVLDGLPYLSPRLRRLV
jgi:two-component system invasion response regulator UvrY